jgi:hypothetical protein
MYALRYRTLVSGWWIDGCYTYFGYNDDLLKPYFDAARAGNGQALVALNHGVMHPISRYRCVCALALAPMHLHPTIPSQRMGGLHVRREQRLQRAAPAALRQRQ